MKRKRWSVFLAALALCVFFLTGTVSAAFQDVAAESPYASVVAEMEAQGLLSGYPDGHFYPARTISSAQFVTIAARCAGLEPVPAQTNHWAAGSLQAALQAGWYDWDELPPTGERFDLPIFRHLAVKILIRAFLPEVRGDYLTESWKINDFARLDDRYYESVLAAYAAGVVTGDAQGNFNPTGSLSRGAACILFQNVLKASAKRDNQRKRMNQFPHLPRLLERHRATYQKMAGSRLSGHSSAMRQGNLWSCGG